MNLKITLFFISLISLWMIACNQMENTNDEPNDFYKNTRKGDLFRLPLIEPHELLSTGKTGHGWFLRLPQDLIPFEKQLFVDSVSVVDNIIFTKTNAMEISNKGNTGVWCVIQNGFHVFYNEPDCQAFLKEKQWTLGVFQHPDELFSSFEQSFSHLKILD